MSILTSTLLPSSLLIPRRTKPINSPNNKVVFHKNDHYLNRIVTQKKKASFCIQAQAQQVEPSIPSSPIIYPTVRPKFVLFGSSIVQFSYHEGWGATLAHLYARQVDLILRGYAGWNSRNALRVLDSVFPKNATQQPSLVIVYFGGNDATNPRPGGNGPHVPLEEYKENMKKIVIHLQSLSEKTRVIFLSTPPINEDQIFGDRYPPHQRPMTNESHRIYSEAGLEVSRELNIKAIDLWSAIQEREDWKDVSFSDGIHFTNEGSKVVSREILKVLREADWKPSLHWRDMPIEFEEYYTLPTGPGGEPTDEQTLVSLQV
ncbi:PREDICTED: GDSL esterase/lipase CPRD49-like [Lupinus angustifolius]|uniref:GDSL esterase/lipase CPRD49-like n=1 Tax=Lupinus angustifolius TaxID=3871 RepID=UPI00092E594A|nr:PREDICTED: GDSL esterase/lipase CPRD49-like [Lupinus angustifolius]